MTGQQLKFEAFAGTGQRIARLAAVGGLLAVLAGCDLFGPQKISEQPIIPPDTLYNSAFADMNGQRYNSAIGTLAQL